MTAQVTNTTVNRGKIQADGKFFRLGNQRFFLRGVAYGPFPPGPEGDFFKSIDETRSDFDLIKTLNANVVRVYHVPPRWFLDLASEYGLFVFVDIPWNKHRCFLDSVADRQEIIDSVRQAVRRCAGHTAVFGFSVGNEIPPDIVRWYGSRKVERFIEELIDAAKEIDPDCLCTYSNYPSTEYLHVSNQDFICFNVYLHARDALENYIYKLHHLAEGRPLVVGEIGMDSLREGQSRQAEFLSWQIEAAFMCGAAGVVVFTFTDEWYANGELVKDWAMGLTTSYRQPKLAFDAVKEKFRQVPIFPDADWPRVSVIVAAKNAEKTLQSCLKSLVELDYPAYEIILVDDGSTDGTAAIAERFKQVRYIRHEKNWGLGAARNTGLAHATGEVIAFTDADCRVDRYWLRYLVAELIKRGYAGVGGPNLLPPEDPAIAVAVNFAPGVPRHVMLTHREAEHLPGCNMAFYKRVLEEVGGFDPDFRVAGDDVDICWRLQDLGYKLGFSPAAVVWHHRRDSIAAYLVQQFKYGEAESILRQKHPQKFSRLGSIIWQGRIYGRGPRLILPWGHFIYRGRYATSGFQSEYLVDKGWELTNITSSLEYWLLVIVPLFFLSIRFSWTMFLGLAALIFPALCAGYYAFGVRLPKTDAPAWWVRFLIGMLHLLGPMTRSVGRHARAFRSLSMQSLFDSLKAVSMRESVGSPGTVAYWVEDPRMHRLKFIQHVVSKLKNLECPHEVDSGWCDYDIEVQPDIWSRVRLCTVCEVYPGNKRIIRCRVDSALSSLAKVLLGVIGLIVLAVLWSKPLLLILAGVLGSAFCVWGLKKLGGRNKSVMVTLLDEVAAELGLHKIERTNLGRKEKQEEGKPVGDGRA